MDYPWDGKIITTSEPLRSKPQKDDRRPNEGVLLLLKNGTFVKVLGHQGEWWNVRVTVATLTVYMNNTYVGYVRKESVNYVFGLVGAQSKPAHQSKPAQQSKPAGVKRDGAGVIPKHLLDKIQPKLGRDKDATFVAWRENSVRGSSSDVRTEILDGLQTFLDLVGFIPGLGEVADVANAGISALRGNYLDAALSLISVIPVLGDTIGKGAKYALKFADSGVARKTLEALKKADLPSFFRKLAQHTQLKEYVDALQQSVESLVQTLNQIAGLSSPQFALAGGISVPSNLLNNQVVRMSSNLSGGFKQGDHVFNKGLTKLGLEIPQQSLLKKAFKEFQDGIKEIELKGGFEIKANKGAKTGADLNSTLFGDQLDDLRDAWSHLNQVLNNSSANSQQYAAAVLWATESLKKLRQASFDSETALVRSMEASSKKAKEDLAKQLKETHKKLDDAFDKLTKEIEKLSPTTSAVGQSMAGISSKPRASAVKAVKKR